MKTTVNLPDALMKEAKRKAFEEGRTFTDLVVEGLRGQIAVRRPVRKLPVSTAAGGLAAGVDWRFLQPADSGGESYR